MQGITFNMEGPVVSGYWYNPKTGDSFTVRDSYFENNQFMITTTDGRVLEYNQIQNYIQSDKPIETKNMVKIQDSSVGYIPDSIKDMVEECNKYDNYINQDIQSMKPQYEGKRIYDDSVNEQPNNYYIIDRALSKLTLPKIKVDVTWGTRKAPKEELMLLSNIMDIPVEDIVKWYISKFDSSMLNVELQECIKHAILKEFEVEGGQDIKTGQKPDKIARKQTKTK